MAFSQDIYTGKIDRLSGSDNAIVKPESVHKLNKTTSIIKNEINLGPLPEEAVGEEVPFAYSGSGTFGLCLAVHFINEDYLNYIDGRVEIDSIEPRKYISSGEIPEDVDTGDVLLANDVYSITDHEMSDDTSPDQHFAVVGSTSDNDWSFSAIVEEPVIQNKIPTPVIQNKIPTPVKVKEIRSTWIEAKWAHPETETKFPDNGQEVSATTVCHTEMGTLAIYETDRVIPILIKDTKYPISNEIKIEIIDSDMGYVIGEAVFSSKNPDTIHFRNKDRLPEEAWSKTRVIENKAPIDIEPVPEGTTPTGRITITGESKEALVGRWDIIEEIGPIDITAGDEITLDIQSVYGKSCVGYYERFPVQVNFGIDIPEEFQNESIAASIHTVQPDKAVAEPVWITETDEPLDVRIVGTAGGDAFAIKDGHCVKIPNASVVNAGNQMLIGLLESSDSHVATGAVSARPVFQNSDEFHLLRLPHTQGDVVQADGTHVTVDHLFDIDTPVTLGVAEVNEDHVVPTVTALPETHLPGDGDYVSMKCKNVSNNVMVAVGEELLLKLPIFQATEMNTITARVLERNPDCLFGVVGNAGGDDSKQFWKAYEYIQMAGLAIERKEFKQVIEYLNKAIQACPSEFPVMERLLAAHEAKMRAIFTIRANTEFGQTISRVSDEADKLRDFNHDENHTEEVVKFIAAREAEMRAVEHLLTALNEVDSDTSDLQAIAQGVSAKDPVVKAVEHLNTVSESTLNTQFEDQIPSPAVRSIIHEFEQVFPSVVDEVQSFKNPKYSADWFQHLLPEWILNRIDEERLNTETNEESWERPRIPSQMGIFTVSDTATDGDKSKKPMSATADSKQECEGSDNQDSGSDGTNHSEIGGLLNSSNAGMSASNEPESEPGEFDEEVSEKASTTESISDESTTETTTTEQTSSAGKKMEEKAEPEEKEAIDISTTSAAKTSESGSAQESFSFPDNSPKLQKLRKKAETEASESPEREQVETTTNRYRRSSAIKEYALERANGVCELCGEDAPFVKPNGNAYLEVHHVNELGDGGADHPSKVGAICPSCHREIHHGKHGDELNQQLKQRLEEGLGDVGSVSE